MTCHLSRRREVSGSCVDNNNVVAPVAEYISIRDDGRKATARRLLAIPFNTDDEQCADEDTSSSARLNQPGTGSIDGSGKAMAPRPAA